MRMPPATIAQMLQAAFRVVGDRDSLRLAFLLGFIPGLVGYVASVVVDTYLELGVWGGPLGLFAGDLVGRLATLPQTVRAGGDLLARRLNRPPQVEPGVAVSRAFRLFTLFVVTIIGMGAASIALQVVLGEGPVAVLVSAATFTASVYVGLGFTMGPQAVFYEDEGTAARSFAIVRGDRPRILAFLMVVNLPFVFGGLFVTSLGGPQPSEPVLLVLSLIAGFVGALATGPMFIGLTVLYFGKRGETPPDVIDPAAPRT